MSIIIVDIMSILIYSYSCLIVDSLWLKLMAIIICASITAILVFKIGLTREERNKVITIVNNKLKR